MVTVAGVGAGVGFGVGAAVGVGVAIGAREEEVEEDGERKAADATPVLRTALARATPPAVRNCRLVAIPDLMSLRLLLEIFQKDDGNRHGFARWRARPSGHHSRKREVVKMVAPEFFDDHEQPEPAAP